MRVINKLSIFRLFVSILLLCNGLWVDFAKQNLSITDLEKDASGNYLTPDSPIVQSLPEYNKDMKIGDIFKYLDTTYPIWGELLDASKYNYI